MWLVKLALRRPYTFVIISVLILIAGVVAILTSPTDILPDIQIPIVSVIWTYNGLDADDMSVPHRSSKRRCIEFCLDAAFLRER